ncbi:hypothetical protein Pth03_07900 [Planotetraspora thailandica]|uniref:Uncharacterized protein n=1 Tax=Planotetraspora thailandica TaxID=487172 RepID=A0A8J3XU87_9ACTN|nr:ATP-binding protein [Planotetraspora thailandica]GII52401.1 hypothetical protein Pth03_07900 [Planotetraspora thailandica]
MPPDNVRYELYGLPDKKNPYVNRPLDALTDSSDQDLLLELEGFIQLAGIEAAVDRAVREGRPAFFLIIGAGGSGRTSLSNHVMRSYQDRRWPGQEGDNLCVHRSPRTTMTHDPYRQLTDTLLSLRNNMKRRHIEISDDLKTSFRDLSRSQASGPLSDYDLQEIAELVSSDVATRGSGLGIHYEGVATKELLALAPRVFENTQAVMVLTVDAYDHAGTPQLTESDKQEFAKLGHVIHLEALTPAQISMLALKRWNGTQPSPFDPGGVESAFTRRRYTIGQAMRYLAMLLDFRLSEYHDAEPWPTAELRLHEDWLQTKMWQGENWARLDDPNG